MGTRFYFSVGLKILFPEFSFSLVFRVTWIERLVNFAACGRSDCIPAQRN